MIHFVTGTGPYEHVLQSIVRPIRKHLDSTESDSYIPGESNVRFFRGEKGEIFHHHGMSDKNYIARGLKFNHYLIPGQILHDKLKHMGYKSHIVGWAAFDTLLELKRRPGGKRVLWAPTHNAIQNVSSYPTFESFLDKFPSDWEVTSSVHPARKSDNTTTEQALVDADVVISDCSTLLYEAWALGKPVIFPDWLVKDGIMRTFPQSVESAIYQHGIGLHARSYEEMVDMLEGEIDDRVTRFMEQMFPTELRGCSGKRTAEVLRSLE